MKNEKQLLRESKIRQLKNEILFYQNSIESKSSEISLLKILPKIIELKQIEKEIKLEQNTPMYIIDTLNDEIISLKLRLIKIKLSLSYISGIQADFEIKNLLAEKDIKEFRKNAI